MGKQPNGAPTNHESPRTKSAAILLLGDIADTTWRMFVPTIGMTLLGSYLDTQWRTKPVMLAIGIVSGAALAIILVRRQLKRIESSV